MGRPDRAGPNAEPDVQDAKPTIPNALSMTRPVVVLLAVFLSSALTFSNLAFNPLNDWDEAWHARVALDIARNNTFLTYTDDGEIHYALASTKPPLYFWLMAISIKWIGPTEFAIRLFPAACHVATVAIVAAFCCARLNWTVALAAALLLSANKVMVFNHGARTGDIDSQLTLFLTLTMIGAYRLLGRRLDWWFPLVWAAALLTKGTAALQIVPAIVLFLVWQRAWRALGWAIGGLVVGTIPLLAFVLVREQWQPGIVALMSAEVGARFTTPVDDVAYDPLRYVAATADSLAPAIVGLVMLAIAVRGRLRVRWQAADESEAGALLRWLLLWWLVPSALFTLAKTQHVWYIAPSLVPASILFAWAIRAGLSQLEHRGGRHIGPLVALVVVGAMLVPAVWKSMVIDRADMLRRAEFDRFVETVSRQDSPRPIIDYSLAPAERYYLAQTGVPVRRAVSPAELRKILAEYPNATLVYPDSLSPQVVPALADLDVEVLVSLPERSTSVVAVTRPSRAGQVESAPKPGGA